MFFHHKLEVIPVQEYSFLVALISSNKGAILSTEMIS